MWTGAAVLDLSQTIQFEIVFKFTYEKTSLRCCTIDLYENCNEKKN